MIRRSQNHQSRATIAELRERMIRETERFLEANLGKAMRRRNETHTRVPAKRHKRRAFEPETTSPSP